MNIKSKKIISLLFFIFVFSGFLFLFKPVFSQVNPSVVDDVNEQINAGANSAGFGAPQDPRIMIVKIIKTVISLLGIIFFALIVFSGYLYLTSNGDETKIQKAKDIIIGAIIGEVLVLISYSIVVFVSQKIVESTGYGQLF